ncbi:MAG TPA: hypothetical protein VMI54_12955 [Polyangiaceae bacterium]|nr:hypothetical protein [Polyangiaceae bacterium]
MKILRWLGCGAALVIAVSDTTVFWFERDVNSCYVGTSRYSVASYAWPWALVPVVLGVGLAVLTVLRAAFRREAKLGRLAGVTALAWLASLLLCAEAGMGIYYQSSDGEFTIAWLLFPRVFLDFPSSSDGVCLKAEFGAFSWTLNGTVVHPRLLPLPLDDTKLRDALTHPGICVRP